RPPPHSRGSEALLGKTPAERAANHQRILAAAPKSLRPLIIIMEATGCRPGELCNARADHFDAGRGTLTFKSVVRSRGGERTHKTAAKDKDRVIVLQGEGLEIVRQLAARFPTGPLFRRRAMTVKGERSEGRGWTSRGVTNAFKRIRDKLGIPDLSAY